MYNALSIKKYAKGKVFSFLLKAVKDLQLLISSGREFHNTGAIYENALRPYVLRLHLGITSEDLLEERNVLEGIYGDKSHVNKNKAPCHLTIIFI